MYEHSQTIYACTTILINSFNEQKEGIKITKTCITAFSSFVLSFSVYANLNPGGYINSFIESGTIFLGIRVTIVLCLLAYTFIPNARRQFTSNTMLVASLGLMAFGITSLVSPTLLGNLDNFFALGDSILVTEAGILALLISRELPITYAEPTTKTLPTYDPTFAIFQNVLMAGSDYAHKKPSGNYLTPAFSLKNYTGQLTNSISTRY